MVRASGLDWIIPRPARLVDGPRTGRDRVLTDVSGVDGGKIARANVADFVVKQLADTRYLCLTHCLSNRRVWLLF